MSLADEKYVSVSTFRKSGAAVATPTWIVPLADGQLGFWTSSITGKAKRLRNDPRLTMQPSDARGRVKAGTEAVEGTVSLVTSGPLFDEVTAKVKAKYGIQVPLSKFMGKVARIGKGGYPYADIVVLVTPASPAALDS
jgi:hypothetical protein